MNVKKSWCKNWYIFLICVATLVVIIVIPIIINELYKWGAIVRNPYITLWGADDLLTFYGSVLAFVGTVVLGIAAIKYSKNANEINNRLLKIEEERQMPLIDFFDYEIDFNNLVRPLPVMSFHLTKNLSLFKEIRLLIRNINEISIDKIEIVEIEVFQTSQNNTSSEVKHQFDEIVTINNEHEGYMNQISALEYKELLFLLPSEIRAVRSGFDNTNLNINTRFEMILRLTTYSQRTYLQKIEFVNYYAYLVKENKVTSKIINKHISIKEEK